MWLTEKIKNAFLKAPENPIEKKNLPYDKILQDFSAEDAYLTNFGFFDSAQGVGYVDRVQRVAEQATKIDIYRNTAKNDNVKSAIKTLANEVVYSEDFKKPLILNVDIDNAKIEKSIQESFEKILKLFNINKNFYRFVINTYIDGQANVLLEYHEKQSDGIKSILFIDPKYLSYDFDSNAYKYIDFLANNSKFYNRMINAYDGEIKTYKPEEIVHSNFGLVSEDGLILSELEDIVKTANQLKTLEDLLIPLRFSRSISRQVFNVDVSDLPNSKAESYLKKIANMFKYRKEYNTQTGEIKNQQHMTSMVEDYWISSRGGQKGINVDLLNETGDLGNLEDLQYYRRKLYQGMGIPQNRILDNEDTSQSVFDLQADSISNEDMQFFMKIRRIRDVYSEFFKQILKRELISTKKFTEKQYNEYKDQINVVFPSENQFIERMNVTLFLKKVDAFNSCRELGGKVLPVSMLYKTLFGYDEKEIKDIFKEIEKESKNKLYKTFYQSDEFGSNSDYGDEEDEKPKEDGKFNPEKDFGDSKEE